MSVGGGTLIEGASALRPLTCHPEPGRRVLANVGEGPAVPVLFEGFWLQLRSLHKRITEVFPRWIVALDQPELFLAAPALDFLLARDGEPDVAKGLEVYQSKNSVLAGESRNEPVTVFDHSAQEVVCYTGVQGSRTAGQNVNVVGAVARLALVQKRKAKSRSLTTIRQQRATGFGMTS